MSIDPRLFFTYTKHPKSVDLRKEKQLFDQNFLIKFLSSKEETCNEKENDLDYIQLCRIKMAPLENKQY